MASTNYLKVFARFAPATGAILKETLLFPFNDKKKQEVVQALSDAKAERRRLENRGAAVQISVFKKTSAMRGIPEVGMPVAKMPGAAREAT